MNDLERRFSYHPPQNAAVALTHEIWRANCMALARIMEQLPETRERSTAISKIEEAMMWGNAAIARNGHALPLAVREIAKREQDAAKAAEAAAPAARPWHQVLGCFPNDRAETVREAWNALIDKHHPATGGDPAAFKEVLNAWEQFKVERGVTA